MTRRETLEGLGDWIQAARKEEPRMPIVVLGNKADLTDERRVTKDEARAHCQGLGFPYLPTSAKTGLNVETAFRELCSGLLRTYAPLVAEKTPP